MLQSMLTNIDGNEGIYTPLPLRFLNYKPEAELTSLLYERGWLTEWPSCASPWRLFFRSGDADISLLTRGDFLRALR